MYMRRILLWALCGTLSLTAAGIFPYPYQQHDLPNGLRLVTIKTDFPNVVALYIVVQTGSRNEIEPGKTGFAHFFEHMMFRGTRQYPTERFNQIMKEAGASVNAYTSDDLTAYHVTFSKPDLETMLKVEADRFQNLDYSEAAFKTEALAVLGEYNKNSANPFSKIDERLCEMAFLKHTYRHTTIGFLDDIKDMPNQFAYSREFFNRWYRPEYTTVVVSGDIDPAGAKQLVEKHWGGWKRGAYKAEIPVEGPPEGPKDARIDWPSPTLPILAIAHRSPAYSDTTTETAALDLLSFLAFSENAPLYRKLVLEEQKVDLLSGGAADHVDPNLFTVFARVKKTDDIAAIREAILSTLAGFKDTLVSKEELDKVKRHVRYRFVLGLDDSESVASTAAAYIALRRTPETINKVYDLYARITPEDIRDAARKVFVEKGRFTVTLVGAAK
jgi:zinc protease